MIYKRGEVYWYSFQFRGERIRESTRQGNANLARQMEAHKKTRLAEDDAGLKRRGPVPTLREFEEKFLDEIRIRRAAHPETVQFYECKFAGLLRFQDFANARLDRIDQQMIARFIARMIGDDYERSTVNRHLATLRRALRLAKEWGIVASVPSIKLLSGENQREFVLTRDQQGDYLSACPEFLRNWSTFALETGMRRKELVSLRWSDVHLLPIGNAKRGYVAVRGTKSTHSKRNVSLTGIAQSVLARQKQISECEYVFVSDQDHKKAASVSAVNHCHERVRNALQMPTEFVLHSLRHTFGTRLGESGCDAFTIMRLMGHSTITVSQRYVHPTPDTMERAMLSLERASQISDSERFGVATKTATVEEARSERIQ